MPKRLFDSATNRKQSIRRKKMSRRLSSSFLTPSYKQNYNESRSFGVERKNQIDSSRLLGMSHKNEIKKKNLGTPIRFTKIVADKVSLKQQAQHVLKKRSIIVQSKKVAKPKISEKKLKYRSDYCSPLTPMSKIIEIGPRKVYEVIRKNKVSMKIEF